MKLISIHINKTAGTSFEKILRNNYNKVFRINTHTGDEKHRGLSCHTEDLLNNIPKDTEVLHGHFKAMDILDLDPNPVVTWLRNPTHRVISNYFYSCGDKQISIEEYISNPENQNKMYKMLEGIKLKSFFFIGIKEHFTKDILELANTLGWKNIDIPVLNKTDYPEVGYRIRNLITELNHKDWKLYNKALKLRYDRRAKLKLV